MAIFFLYMSLKEPFLLAHTNYGSRWKPHWVAIHAHLTLFRPMEFSIQPHTIMSELSIVYIEGSWVIISKKILYFFLSLKINFILANSADPDERLHYAAFHLGLHCLLKYPFRGFWSKKGLIITSGKHRVPLSCDNVHILTVK